MVCIHCNLHVHSLHVHLHVFCVVCSTHYWAIVLTTKITNTCFVSQIRRIAIKTLPDICKGSNDDSLYIRVSDVLTQLLPMGEFWNNHY